MYRQVLLLPPTGMELISSHRIQFHVPDTDNQRGTHHASLRRSQREETILGIIGLCFTGVCLATTMHTLGQHRRTDDEAVTHEVIYYTQKEPDSEIT